MTRRIKCPKCKGKGTVPLSPRLEETLDVVRRFRTGAMVADVHKALGVFADYVGTTAINNRLEDLRRLGLVRREGTKPYYYFAV